MTPDVAYTLLGYTAELAVTLRGQRHRSDRDKLFKLGATILAESRRTNAHLFVGNVAWCDRHSKTFLGMDVRDGGRCPYCAAPLAHLTTAMPVLPAA